MSEPGKAVFLSYASQDAEAAKRICESLRAAGVEVWFDADGGLEHGDEWDRKIRRQIKECVLFLPIISTNTQAREEGYFRIEWDLAAERARGIASGVAYILPVVIDDTREPDALVPDRFRAVQWTRLPGGVVPPDVLQRFLKLWSHRTGALKHAENVGRDLRIPPPSNEAGFGDPALQKKQKKRRLWLIPVIAALAVAAGLWQQQRNRAKIVSSEPEGQAIAPAAPLSPARQLAAKSAKLHDQLENASRSDLELAEQYCQQAVALDPNDGELWAEYSLVNSNFIALGYDRSNERIQATRTQADRAVKLAPESNEAEFALATSYRWQGAMRDEAINRLRKLVERMPGDRRVLRTLGNALRLTGKSEEALLWYTRAAALPGGDPLALFQRAMALEALGRNEEAAVTVDESLAQHPGAAAHILKVLFLLRWGELDQARLTLDKVPAPFLLEDRGALAASMVFYRQRQWDRGLGALLAVPHDYFDDTYYRGPKGLLTGDARFYAGRKIAAELDWRAALQLVNQRLAGTKDTALLHLRKAELHARLGEADEADRALRAFRELQGGGGFLATARIELWLKRNEAALQSLQAYEFTREVRVMLRQDPEWDPLRGDPRFQALLVEPAAPSPSSLSLPPSGPPPPDQKSVAVLAFANLSDDKANEYFSDGISEELLNVLAKVPKLKVAARTSSFHFKGKDTPIPEIARQLGVAYVVEGSVRKAGNKVRVTAQLIKAADGFHVWSETYDRDLTDIFAVQDEIAKNILGVVKGSLMGEADLPHATTTNIEAYTLFLQAQGSFAKRGEAGLRESIRLFEAALAIDPNYVPALVGLAQARVVLPNYAYLSGAKARETVDAALKAARRALELDPRNAAAFAVIGWAKFQFEWRWSESEAALLRARDLAPNDHWNWNCLGDYYRFVGDFPQALAAKQREWELDPLSPNSHWDLSYVHLLAGNYDQAIYWADLCVKLAPHNVDSYMPGILAAGRAGRFDLMRRTFVAARRNVPEGEGMMLLLEAYGAILEKKPDEARRFLTTVMPLAEAGTASPAYVGFCLLLLGDADQAVIWLQRGYDRSDPAMVWNEIIDFDVIAGNPKTRPLLDQPGLKELYELRQRNARAGLSKL